MTVGGRLAIGTGGPWRVTRETGRTGPARRLGGLKRASSGPGDPGFEASLIVHSKGQP